MEMIMTKIKIYSHYSGWHWEYMLDNIPDDRFSHSAGSKKSMLELSKKYPGHKVINKAD